MQGISERFDPSCSAANMVKYGVKNMPEGGLKREKGVSGFPAFPPPPHNIRVEWFLREKKLGHMSCSTKQCHIGPQIQNFTLKYWHCTGPQSALEKNLFNKSVWSLRQVGMYSILWCFLKLKLKWNSFWESKKKTMKHILILNFLLGAEGR